MKPSIFIIALITTFCVGSVADDWGVISRPDKPIPENRWNEKTKVWLGRSCVGEAGFTAYEEYVAIAWVYATRYREIGYRGSFERLIRKYSAAVKKHSSHKRPWILSLNAKGDRPKKWPNALKWEHHRPMWLAILNHLDEWVKGNRPNPVPEANHFGGHMDTPGSHWTRIRPTNGLKFNNIFYSSF